MKPAFQTTSLSWKSISSPDVLVQPYVGNGCISIGTGCIVGGGSLGKGSCVLASACPLLATLAGVAIAYEDGFLFPFVWNWKMVGLCFSTSDAGDDENAVPI